MKHILLFCAVLGSLHTRAQDMSSSASQTIQLIVPARINIANYLQIDTEKAAKSKKTGKGAAKEYFRVQSNKNYTVSISVDTTGHYTQTVADDDRAIAIKLSNMRAEVNPFLTSYNSFRPISRTQQNVLMTCVCGSDERFSVSYNEQVKNNLLYTVTEQ